MFSHENIYKEININGFDFLAERGAGKTAFFSKKGVFPAKAFTVKKWKR